MKALSLNSGETGLVFNIQKFSVHDGPGIRTTVFLKGCPLHCLWCSNPESQNPFPDLMVRDVLCKGCGACVAACPQGAITLTREEGRKIDRQQCNRCMTCVPACLYQSLQVCGKFMTVDEVLEEVLQDRLFYKNSGGGVTLSGGEVLMQSRFAKKILKQCKNEGLHTVLDTAGAGSWKDLEGLLPFVDLLLFDLKHLDSKEHQRTTGVSNDRILKNLTKAAAKAPLWLRIPLIAGFNDSEQHIKKIAALSRRLKVQKISFLPYHEGGKSKSGQLGISYPLPEAAAPHEEHIHNLQGIIEKVGIKVSIGN
ncbi:MAG: glycyl-radical enzyme activating protein [Thermodesulfobacteriota bacterium]